MGKFLKALKNLGEYIRRGGVTYVKLCVPMNFEEKVLLGKTVLVIGGSSGIGKSISKGMVEMGANVIVTGTNEKHLSEIDEEIEGVVTIKWDISDTNISDMMIKQCKKYFGSLDILINCAGVYDGTCIDAMTADIYDKVMNINLKGTYFCTQAFIKHCDASSECVKKIINILSINSKVAHSHAYSLSKWGELAFTEGLAKELLERNIVVNAIAPGPTVSNISDDNRRDPDGNLHNSGRRYAKYFMRPEQVSNVAKFLASDFSLGIVGQMIVVDGGETLL